MNEISPGVLISALIMLVILSAFFSSAETGLISLNRFRLRHLAKINHRGAVRSLRLLERPDRLIGLILLGNNLVNILASFIAALLAYQWYGETGLAIAPFLLTLVILIFGEVAPKTLAILNPERIAFPATLILQPLLRIFYPFVWMVNKVANALLRLAGMPVTQQISAQLTTEELRTVLSEAGAMIPQRHQEMLTSILDLEKVSVEDIMIPRPEIIGIDLDDDWEDILEQLGHIQHTRLPVYRNGDINNIIGILHLRNMGQLFHKPDAGKADIEALTREAYFIPEGTPLHTQLLNFQRKKRRIALVVNEYGDIQGLVTLEDILEEIVGDFTTDPSARISDVHPQRDGTYLVEGNAYLRDLNRIMGWELPTDGPKTLNGLIIEHLENIPEPGTSLLIAGYPIEIVQSKDNSVKIARINPEFRKEQQQESERVES